MEGLNLDRHFEREVLGVMRDFLMTRVIKSIF